MYASKAATLSRSASTTTSGTDAFGHSEPSVFGPARLAHWAARLTRLALPFAGRRAHGARTAALAAGLALTLAGPGAQAQTSVTLVSSIKVTGFAATFDKDYAQAFTTGSHAGGYKLTDVDISLHGGSGSPAYTVTVRADSGSNTPGATSLGTLSNPAWSGTDEEAQYTASGTGIDLAASTKYWVMIDVSTTDSSATIWSTSSDSENSGAAQGWSIGDSRLERNASSTGGWTTHTNTLQIAIKGHKIGPPARPAAPTVNAVPLQPDRLAVRWSAPAHTGGRAITDYDVRYYQGSADPANEADWIEAGETGGHDHVGTLAAATITGLMPVTTYRVQVRATNSAGTGPWSPSGSGRTEALVGAWGSSVLELVGNTGETVQAYRSLASDDVAQGFRSAGHDLGYTVTDVDLHFPSAPDAGVRVRLATGLSPSNAGTTLATLRNPAALAAGVNTFTAPAGTILNANTDYFVVVEGAAGTVSWTTSRDQDGLLGWDVFNGDYTRAASSTGGWGLTLGGSVLIRVNGRKNVGDPPGAPGTPIANAESTSTGINVSWTAPRHTGSGITDYDLRYYEGSADPANEADWVEEAESTGLSDVYTADASRAATITGLKPSTAYRVQVRAESHGAPGPWSASRSVTTNAGTGSNSAPTLAQLAPVAANGCIAYTGSGSRGSYTITAGVLQSIGRITDTSQCESEPRKTPIFIDPDGDDLTMVVTTQVPDNVRLLDGTPWMDSARDRVWIRAVAAGSATNIRVDLTAIDPHGQAVSAWFDATVGLNPNNATPRFDEMVGMRGFPPGVPIPRWVLPPANGGNVPSTNSTGQLPYFYAVSGLPPGLAFDPMTRVVTGTPTTAGTYTVTYTADDADAAYSLKASPTATDIADAARQSFVVQIGAPAIELVQMVSAPTYDADGDGVFDTYIAGDQILVDVQFSEAVEVTGTPETAGGKALVPLDLGPSTRPWSVNRVAAHLLEEGGELYGGRRLRFGYTVQGGNGQACSVATTTADCDSDGVWVQTTIPTGTVVLLPDGLSLTSKASGAAAVLTFPGLPTSGAPNAKVDGSMTSADVGPRPVSAATDTAGDTVTVTFNRALSMQVDLSGVPLSLYYSVRGAGVVGSGQSGQYQHPNSVAVRADDNTKLVLELNTPANASDTVTLSYENLGAGVWPIKDQSSPPKRVAGFIDLAVTNNSRGVAAPVPTSASAVGTALEVVFDQRLDQDSRPSGSAFTVSAEDIEGARRTIAGVDTAVVIDDAKVAVTLAAAVASGELLRVSYAKPAASPLRDAAGSAAVASFERFHVAGVYDSTAPTLLSKMANILLTRANDPANQGKSNIMLYYDERLDRTSVPAAADFALSSDDTNAVAGATVASVAVEDTAVVLTTSHWLKDNIDYTLTYTPGTAPIEDLAGNAAAAFTETVRSFAVGRPVLRGSSVAGTRLELNMKNPLNPGAVPPPSAFTLWEKDPAPGESELHEFTGGRIVSVAVNASLAVLQLNYPVYPCSGQYAFRVSYTLPSSGDERFQTAAGWGADGWTATKWRGQANDYALVTNARHGRCAEWLAGTYIGSVVLQSERAFARNRGEPEPQWFTVTASGGPVRVTGAAFSPDDPKELKLSLSREFAAGETVTVSYRRPGGASGLWDVDGNQLKNVVSAHVQEGEPEDSEALTAGFHGLPDNHDGGTLFGFEVRFSEEFRGLTLTKLKRALSVTGGRLVDAKRTVRGENRRVTVRVRPSGIGAVRLALAATTDCTDESAICASDGRKLSATVSATVAGPPPVVGVADAHADEGGTLAFNVSLSRAAAGQVTVDYATGDGSAAAGGDYTAASGTLTFAAGETAKTVEVALLTDAAAEDDETLTLTLSGARGATIGDGTATGTVANVAPPPDTTPPAPESAEVDGHIASVTFDEDLSPPGSTSWFNFHWTITGTGVRHHPESAWISGTRTVTMRLAPDFPAVAGQTVTLTYEPGPFLKDAAGNQVAFFTIVAKNLTLPVLTVADAQAHEGGEEAALDFVVRLNAGVDDTVTVGYATSDGSATAGEDYTATSGTLSFAPGETEKTVSVRVLDDVVDEGAETLTFRLSNAQGARIGDGTATGTITNSDPLQKMILSRIGRTKADHLTRAVADRLSGPLTGAQVTVGGQTFNLAERQDETQLGETLTSIARALGAVEEPQPADNDWPGTGLRVREPPTLGTTPARGVSGRELLLGSAFHVAREGDGGGPGLAAWGRVEVGGFDGEAPADAGTVRIDGNVTTGILGADAEWKSLLAGVAVSVSDGEGTFDQPEVDSGTFETKLTTVSPYARVMLNERVSTWGLVGFGTGDMTITQAANDRGQPERITRTDLKLRMGAIGGSGALLEASESGGMDLTLKADAFFVETESEAVSNEGDTTADASRMRLILDGSRPFATATGGVLTPGLELGLRHDGGDAETGAGIELGGRLSWAHPGSGLSMEARARTLVAHEESGYEEWGASGALRLAPGGSGRGLSFSLAPTWGAPSSSTERLWSARDAGGLAPDGEFDATSRLEAELGYGLPAFGGRFTGTPNFGLGLSDDARDYRLGWRLTPAAPSGSGLEVNLDATRRERDNGAGAAEHGITLTGGLRW